MGMDNRVSTGLISAPILAFPSFDLPFVLDTDASNAGLGAVLSQSVHGTERVIAYASRVLTMQIRTILLSNKKKFVGIGMSSSTLLSLFD